MGLFSRNTHLEVTPTFQVMEGAGVTKGVTKEVTITATTTALAAASAAAGSRGTRGDLTRAAAVVGAAATAGPSSRGTSKGEEGRGLGLAPARHGLANSQYCLATKETSLPYIHSRGAATPELC